MQPIEIHHQQICGDILPQRLFGSHIQSEHASSESQRTSNANQVQVQNAIEGLLEIQAHSFKQQPLEDGQEATLKALIPEAEDFNCHGKDTKPETKQKIAAVAPSKNESSFSSSVPQSKSEFEGLSNPDQI